MPGPGPTILAFDTSAAHCAVALLRGGRMVADRYEETARGQAERLFPILETVLAEAGAAWRDLDAVGVGTGPGNFTGIRIAVSAARGLAMSLRIPALGVSGFDAAMALAGHPAGTVAVCLPAPRGAAYWQLFRDGHAEGDPFLSADPRPLPEAAPPRLVVGPAADGFAAARARRLGAAVEARPVDMGRGLAGAIAATTADRLATRGEQPRPAPLYIRPADAAPPREAPPAILP